jgi:hypothetical protein
MMLQLRMHSSTPHPKKRKLFVNPYPTYF